MTPVFTYRVGQLAYWPPDRNLFVVYPGDGLRVPSPGLIPLGTVDTAWTSSRRPGTTSN